MSYMIPHVCHLDRSATGKTLLKRLFGAEWRDPDEASSARTIQGVFTRLLASPLRL